MEIEYKKNIKKAEDIITRHKMYSPIFLKSCEDVWEFASL